MSRIDVENAKQIRNPMDVLITMEVPDEGITLTYSGYSSAKVADGSLGNAWPMRLLADLKGDGFPLDGSRVVYNPATSASETNGKIGVRSNIGQTVSVTVTGSATIVSLSIFATGATSVTYNGTTSAIVGGQVIIPVGATSITLTFNPASATDRIEVSQIVAGTSLRIANDTLIKAVVSLRSDLSIIDPTLPESELNIEVYNDADISEVVASLPEDTPITYQAGYPGDMSPLRKFYVSGQVTWADNILSIHAVDAVHFLKEIRYSFALGSLSQYGKENPDLGNVEDIITGVLDWCGISYTHRRGLYNFYSSTYRNQSAIVNKGCDARTLIAFIMNTFHINNTARFASGPPSGKTDFWPVYTDAGRPTFSTEKPSARRRIKEDDCADIKKEVDTNIAKVNLNGSYVNVPYEEETTDTSYLQAELGTVEVYKGRSAFVTFDADYAFRWVFNLPSNELTGFSNPLNLIPTSTDGYYVGSAEWLGNDIGLEVGTLLVDRDTPHFHDENHGTVYTQAIPWSARYGDYSGLYPTSMSNMWTFLQQVGYAGTDVQTISIKISGLALITESYNITLSNSLAEGVTEDIEPLILGRVYGATSDGGTTHVVYPTLAFQSIFDKSPVTGSFTWKGDPRMQPRDVVTWERLDGTEETITLENITLTHEKGGTVAEITARKGIV